MLVGVLAIFLLAACGDPTTDAHDPGVKLGTFHVTAARTANTCGEGALGTQAAWTFDVKLSRADRQLLWNNGAELITGSLDADEVTFHFDSGVLIDMRTAADHGLPPCSVQRHDQSAGKLAAAGADVASFTGTLSYDFAPTTGSSCADLNGVVVAALPCGFAYTLAGARVAGAP